jgi:hypothetical protein
MPEVGNDKNATVERGGFFAVQNALIGPVATDIAVQGNVGCWGEERKSFMSLPPTRRAPGVCARGA